MIIIIIITKHSSPYNGCVTLISFLHIYSLDVLLFASFFFTLNFTFVIQRNYTLYNNAMRA